jgi:sulfane dehydrogenase subunit SoxC
MDDLDAVLNDPATFSSTELALAARNHGMPLEAMHYDITPAGLHYLLLHYDIPVIDPNGFRLRIGGRVRASVELTLDDLRAAPRCRSRSRWSARATTAPASPRAR